MKKSITNRAFDSITDIIVMAKRPGRIVLDPLLVKQFAELSKQFSPDSETMRRVAGALKQFQINVEQIRGHAETFCA